MTRQVAIISGGSKGLGAALAADMLSRGHAVATFARSSSPQVAEFEAKYGDSFMFRAFDATNLEATGTFVTDVVKRWQRIHVLINNAATMQLSSLPLMRADVIHKMLALNLEAPINLTRMVSRHMIAHEGGAIVNISTVNAIRGYNGVSVYAATKAGMDAMTRSLAREMGPKQVRVNSVVPGFFDSDLSAGVTESNKAEIGKRTPLRRLGTVQEVMNAVLFLVSPQASFITGQVLCVDGGITC